MIKFDHGKMTKRIVKSLPLAEFLRPIVVSLKLRKILTTEI